MNKKQLTETITERATKLRDELLEMERAFNVKKEEFVRLEGALQALSELED